MSDPVVWNAMTHAALDAAYKTSPTVPSGSGEGLR